MDFLKRHMFYILCSLVAGGGIALMATGYQAMPKVVDEMNKVKSIHQALSNLRSNPASQKKIDAIQLRIDTIKNDRENVFERAKSLYGYTLLVPGSLPDGDSIKRGEFRKVYNEKMNELFTSLNAGGVATPRDMSHARELFDREQAELQESARNPAFVPSVKLAIGSEFTKSGMLTEAGVHRQPISRAHIAAALRVLMYATHWDNEKPPTQISSLEYYTSMGDTSSLDAPEGWDVWHAQLGYWVQHDVVKAINAINEEAALAARNRGEHAWVSNMPVKDLISIRLTNGLVPEVGEVVVGPPAGGYEASLPPGTPETVFTGSGSGNLFDVIQYSVKLIMDQRDVPKLVDQLSRDSFHTLLRISYESVPFNRRMIGKIYGSEPSINVVMDFETIMLGELFRKYMPASVIDFYEVQCRQQDECTEESS